MARIHANVTGIDPSEQLIEAARKHLEQSRHCDELTKRITYRNETIEEHVNNTDTKYDAVVVSEVLEHVSNKREFLRSCTAPLAVSGQAVDIGSFDLFQIIKVVNLTRRTS